jgi:hypothetical protein
MPGVISSTLSAIRNSLDGLHSKAKESEEKEQ